MDDVVDDTMRHRALADPSRRRVLAVLVADGPLGVGDLARRLDLHENTVRAHVRLLVETGLVSSERDTALRRGRPRAIYRAVGSVAGADPDEQERRFEVLAEILAEAMQSGSDVVEAAEAWGRRLVDASPTIEPSGEDDVLTGLVDLLDRFGFDPRIERDRDGRACGVAMTPCPYRNLATSHSDVVCNAHLGIMRGALAELGGTSRIDRLVPFAQPACCRAELGSPASAG